MPFMVRLQCETVDIKVISTDQISILHPHIVELVSGLGILDAAVACNRLQLIQDPQDSQSFLYKLTAHDGRVWQQDIKFEGNTASMTFDVPDYWSLEEFVPNRPVRDLIVLMVIEHGLTGVDAKIEH